ncbi:MAG TPA: YoaK family protein [Actinocrinis sp.]|jgi:uncharacterized membrane protein YoaK (UPF0700 family)
MTREAGAAVRRRQWLLVLLALNSGAIDAVGFVALGGAFTSVMTGNMVLLGIATGSADGGLALRSGVALVCFVAGTFFGARIVRTPQEGDPVWPAPVAVALRVELALLAAFSIGWWAAGSHPTGSVQPVLLGVEAVALGIQSSAVLRFGVSGLSTTYMTGTLTSIVSALANGKHPRNVLPSIQILIGVVAGAIVATVLAKHAAQAVPVLQLVPVSCALIAHRLKAHDPAWSG